MPNSAVKKQPSTGSSIESSDGITFTQEIIHSARLIFRGKMNYLLALGPLVMLGDASGALGKATCFAFSGIALIPCAERLSFVTEQVAEHVNGTVAALLNATFGNAPELLISISALHSGYYRVVQLAMLGSMLTNMLLVFGMSCIIGGVRWHVQELRKTSGNATILMLLVATAGALLPAALILPQQLEQKNENTDIPTQAEISFCRFNAFVMFSLYVCYLIFQLATHKDEFDEELPPSRRTRRNIFCLRLVGDGYQALTGNELDEVRALPLKARTSDHLNPLEENDLEGFDVDSDADSDEERALFMKRKSKAKSSPAPERGLTNGDADEADDLSHSHVHETVIHEAPLISFRCGIFWLFAITCVISAMSDILVDSIHGFALRMRISEVFTSMVIIPFFSNVAEQVSAFLFAYRNEMDLVVGVTIGSAIQIATFVLPGSVLIGFLMGRSMTLYFRAFETVSLVFGVIVTSVVLQGGTTTWLTGMMLVGIYVMFAAGIFFHEMEDLTIDGETLFNVTRH